MQTEGSCVGVPDRTRDWGWVVRETGLYRNALLKAPHQASRNDCMATDLHECTQSTFLLYMFV